MDLNFPHFLGKLRFKKYLIFFMWKVIKKFHLKWLRNSRVMACNIISAQSIKKWLSSWLVEIVHALHGILQCCRVTVLYLDKIVYTLRIIMPNFGSIQWKMAEFLADRNSACAAWNIAVLQGHCFESRLGSFHLENNHAKFQLNPLKNGWDIGSWKFVWWWLGSSPSLGHSHVMLGCDNYEWWGG